MKEQKLSWEFPKKDFVLLRLESLFIAILLVFIFVFSYYSLGEQWFYAVLFTLVFLGIYFLASYVIQSIRLLKEKYELTPKHLEIIRQSRNKVSRQKIHLHEIKHHKLDKVFLGGYLVTHKGKKHNLFFNTKEEAEKFEAFIKRHLKKR